MQYPPPEFVEVLQPIHTTCVHKTGVSEVAITTFSEGAVHADAQLKCYMACVFEETDMYGANGEVHLESVYNALPDSMKDVALKMGLACLKVRGEGRCERAFWLHSCWRRIDPVHYFLV